MPEVLFCLSIGFVGFVVYALVNNQRTTNFRVTGELILAVKPSISKTPRNTAKATKTKSATAELKKASLIVDPILTYLGKNGLTTVAKPSRNLAESRKHIQDRIDLLTQEDTISRLLFVVPRRFL